ncbi:hypothetical protein FSP39_005641 [Pinctada imbricata]|uniref:von Hippel-Lindau disease tumour suppressor beta domain-containing protein n=1 Tax=Pinctada imbricata TaxID=66713 RepID=A0AA89BYT1_PINIB|nr:hypothetical protein FSP39_005641 [Pinctada imbricata]
MESCGPIEPTTVRSLRHDELSCVKFVNRTGRKASVYWFDYSGKLVRYDVLCPKTTLHMNTFMTHPWCAKDDDTNDTLLIDKKKIYLPTPDTKVDEHGDALYGKVIYIDIPVYNLVERCEQIIRQFLPDINISSLEIPTTLKTSLGKDRRVEFRVYKENN